jgi:hypothetical protein
MRIEFLIIAFGVLSFFSNISNAVTYDTAEDYEDEIEELQNQVNELSLDNLKLIKKGEPENIYPNLKKHDNWISYESLKSSNTLLQTESLGNKSTEFVIELTPNNLDKTYSELRVSLKNSLFNEIRHEFNAKLRIDNNPIYSVNASINTEVFSHETEVIFNVPIQFIEQAKKGSFLRLKVESIDKVYKFNLSGFTSAYTRALNLLKENNSEGSFFY